MAGVAGMLCSPALPAPELWSSDRHSWAKGSTAGRGHSPSHGQQGWGGLGGSAVICFVLLCPGAWEGEPMTGRAFHLAPARVPSCRPCGASAPAFVCPRERQISFADPLLAHSTSVSHSTAARLGSPTQGILLDHLARAYLSPLPKGC